MNSNRTINAPSSRSKKYRPLFLVLLSLVIILSTALAAALFKLIKHSKDNPNDQTNLPTLSIKLSDTSIEEINLLSKDIVYPHNQAILTVNDKSTTFEEVDIRGRGNLTWNMPKRPYQIKLSQKTDLFGFGLAKKWVLFADYSDETHLRNSTAFFLQQILNSAYPIKGKHIELYIDDVYYGLYYLSEKVEIDKNRIDLKDPLGLIAELDNLHNTNETCTFYSINGNCLALQDAVDSENAHTAMELFTEKFNRLETAISEKDYSAVAEIIDIDSFAKYFLLNEFAINPDAYGSSFFLYSDGYNDQIHAAAGWDFDAAFGNKHLEIEGVNHSDLINPDNTMFLKNYISNNNELKTTSNSHLSRLSTIIYDLADFPEFITRVKEIYQSTLATKKDTVLEHISTQANTIRTAALKDSIRWKLDLDFDEEVKYLLDWITERYNHFEQIYTAPLTSTTTSKSLF